MRLDKMTGRSSGKREHQKTLCPEGAPSVQEIIHPGPFEYTSESENRLSTIPAGAVTPAQCGTRRL
jgi:hypothetical protein